MESPRCGRPSRDAHDRSVRRQSAVTLCATASRRFWYVLEFRLAEDAFTAATRREGE
jgi:hypothetical protein